MKRILNAAWSRILFVLGITVSAVTISVVTLFFGAEQGLKVIQDIFEMAAKNIGENE